MGKLLIFMTDNLEGERRQTSRYPIKSDTPPSKAIIPLVPNSPSPISHNISHDQDPSFNPYEGCEYAAVFGRHDPKYRDIVFLTVPDIDDGEADDKERHIQEALKFTKLRVTPKVFEEIRDLYIPQTFESDPRLIKALGGRSLELVVKRVFCYFSLVLQDYVPSWKQLAKPLTSYELDSLFPMRQS